MSEEDAVAMLKEKCTNGDFKTENETARGYDILHYKSFACLIKETDEVIGLIGKDKIYTIFSEREINYPENLPKADREVFSGNIYAKLLEKYGKPTHEILKEETVNIDFLGHLSVNAAACWGDCSVEKDYEPKIRAGNDLFAAVGVHNEYFSSVEIHRILVDVKATKAVKEAFEKAVESAKQQEVEEAKKQSQQATESIKF